MLLGTVKQTKSLYEITFNKFEVYFLSHVFHGILTDKTDLGLVLTLLSRVVLYSSGPLFYCLADRAGFFHYIRPLGQDQLSADRTDSLDIL